MAPIVDPLGRDLTPLDYYEGIICLIPTQANPLLQCKIVDGRKLCENPSMAHYGRSLESTVTCRYCRDTWHFRVSSEHFRKEYSKDPETILTQLLDRNSCNCLSCQILQRQFFGESCNRASRAH